ncbi:hypothetical protein BIFGAL_04258 [Bifidobacterium gallicum DSM 20093 = LMG 11596]|uniref:Uncharacterized protein n=1 Tax=Bifidobacterium gallicum DSM 20093 = LMG 11596 TaxID=561180 RepID=D1NWK4_9BIFI|nr:hypothetical protein BIFGAL_04258 [Bifidobacterium gallicum DSM 20093 = LMG 11596]
MLTSVVRKGAVCSSIGSFPYHAGQERCRFVTRYVVFLTVRVRGDAVSCPDMEFC